MNHSTLRYESAMGYALHTAAEGERGGTATKDFGEGSLLRNEPQYPTMGYAPHRVCTLESSIFLSWLTRVIRGLRGCTVYEERNRDVSM